MRTVYDKCIDYIWYDFLIWWFSFIYNGTEYMWDFTNYLC